MLVCMCMCVFKFFFEITEPTEDKVHVGPPLEGEKIYSNDSGQLLFFILILSAPGAGAFSGDFTTNLARQCRAFSRALKIEKLKAPLFRGPMGAGATNDWCITHNPSFTHSAYYINQIPGHRMQQFPKNPSMSYFPL